MYAVAKIELVIAFPGNRNANAVAWKDITKNIVCLKRKEEVICTLNSTKRIKQRVLLTDADYKTLKLKTIITFCQKR